MADYTFQTSELRIIYPSSPIDVLIEGVSSQKPISIARSNVPTNTDPE